jgi:dihydroorotate dehydrogenase electron transfer subunit
MDGMPNPLRAAFYADRAVECRAAVLENVQIAQRTFRIRLAAPEIAGRILPGQFVMVRLPGGDDPLLGRPLALYDTVLDITGTPTAIEIVYLVIGKMTGRLAACRPGDEVALWGPLGNGFLPRETDHLVMVAGGIGQTPFMALGREYLGKRQYGQPPRSVPTTDRVTLCYGARSAALLAGVDEFRAAGIDVRIATDDGSAGHHGLVTELLGQVLDEPTGNNPSVVSCGPEPMMEAVARVCQAADVRCQVSLETPMACGIGICFSCVTKVRLPDGEWDYKRTCVEGPVFDAEQIEW